ncbi:DUF4365 domain-containing protein [[Limnothrix rosea] IAM M-220]|uniref:DUF4365 domain-containing protein n=1 Tax=[Limnothrix rosea] IAM M-220 TaxID=454133 RepID=UPI000962918D|nr:DUF4365 domain-containing protein [[Limnothrix rosea] IAM M-220]OKH19812.1 hypothetical protein NIES208_01430 [[Limnothrix rosea] IAM M-220]
MAEKKNTKDNPKKELFSYGLVQAVSAIHEFSVLEADHNLDASGLDLTIASPYEINGIDGGKLDLQVKCTSQKLSETSDSFRYSIPVKNYNWLIKEKVSVKRVLIVVLVPRNVESWLLISPEKIVAQNCIYWIDLVGEEETSNSSNITISIPKDNILTPDALFEIMKESVDRLFG